MSQKKDDEAKPGKKADKGQNILKLIGACVVLMGSVGGLIHSVPSHRYVEVHADKPRPRVVAKTEPAAPAKPAAKAAPAPAAHLAKQATPAARPASAPMRVASASADAEPALDWQDACEAEIGILCNNVAERRQPRCLRRYDEAIRKDCLKALLVPSGAGPE